MAPQTLYNINAFIGGISFAGDVPSFTLPKLTLKTEEVRNGGMDAPIDMDQGMNKLDLSWTMTGIRKDALKIYGLASGSSLEAVWRGSFKAGTERVGVIVTTRGMITEVDFGDWKSGEKAEFKYAANLNYYKLEIDNAVMYEIDILNCIRIIDGVDQLAVVREHLGI
ncbi:phage major tail tube protein [Pseudomonas sp. 21LCFQ02]|uniref:phage major tail tube protein n=1 Tax=Pseudomonas sp. 21LCFQ02 TaxID=2957505 RepID=UPI00209B472F|nr:phage major tail tube protein [Pseudomonas sp. 21LCFQ02]MCO8167875.1 phage major tail tube protein [Pseudomonas sp. 21LCFQ02]